jgi:hypothetical protein
LRFIRALAAIFVLGTAALFGLALTANAQSPAPRPTATTEVVPEPGNDTLKLASLGIVFLVIGAAVVYAPQIVSAVGAIPRRLTGSGRRKPPPSKPAPAKAAPAPRVEEIRPSPVLEPSRPPAPALPPVVTAPELTVRVGEPDDVVARLQNEVRSAWSRTR